MENDKVDLPVPTEESDIADKVSQELQINLPGKFLPAPVRLIAFFTLAGGLSIVGSLFVDIVRPGKVDVFLYFFRILIGILAIGITYGIIERKRWAIWLYGLIAVISLFTNPVLAIVPAVVFIYLFYVRSIFTPSVIDNVITQVYGWVAMRILKRDVV
jgi:hypothetical protein